jgi:hypothetical protein
MPATPKWTSFLKILKALSPQAKIWLGVVGVHLFLVLFLLFTSYSPHKKQPLEIRTQKIAATSRTPTPPPKKEAKSLPKQTAPSTKAPAKKIAEKKPSKSSTTPPKTQAPSNDQILEDLAKALDEVISSKSEVEASTLSLPALIHPKDVNLMPEVQLYEKTIVEILSQSLDLPEFGEVLVRLEIRSNGKPSKIEILQTKSEKNSDFLKNQLPHLSFPCFNEFGLAEAQLNFTVAFRNVENH